MLAMLALPERVADLLPEQILSLSELQALSDWKRRYEGDALLESALVDVAGVEAGQAIFVARRLRFAAWMYRTGRLSS